MTLKGANTDGTGRDRPTSRTSWSRNTGIDARRASSGRADRKTRSRVIGRPRAERWAKSPPGTAAASKAVAEAREAYHNAISDFGIDSAEALVAYACYAEAARKRANAR